MVRHTRVGDHEDARAGNDDGGGGGGWWVFFGVWMLLNETRLWRFHDSWPLLLVAIGINVIWKELVQRPRAHERVE
jgi:hypothetical protein